MKVSQALTEPGVVIDVDIVRLGEPAIDATGWSKKQTENEGKGLIFQVTIINISKFIITVIVLSGEESQFFVCFCVFVI